MTLSSSSRILSGSFFSIFQRTCFVVQTSQISGPVPSSNGQFYWRWRVSQHPFAVLREQDTPPERLVQNIWHHQRIRRDELRLLDGRSLRVLHPGFWNHGAGPDFADAVLQIGTEPPLAGDVEVDLHSSGWRHHAHHQNPAFERVKLHVVWEGDSNSPLPTLVLKGFIDAPLAELALWLASDVARQYPAQLLGQCAGPLRDLSTEQLEQLLNEAALVRMQRKAHDLHARARQTNWEQALWEGMLRALGYKRNVWPMQRIGELRARLQPGKQSLIETQARFLGVSGLLPNELTRRQRSADRYVKTVWDHWWREQDTFNDCVLPKKVWRLNGLRPANHPQRRLALAAHWCGDVTLFKRIEKWFASAAVDGGMPESLLRVFQPGADDFWSRHWTLRSASMAKPQPLLGATRVTDLAVNVVLPWLWVRAREGNNAKLQAEAERRYFAWPPAEDNTVLRLARDRLLGGRQGVGLVSAALQQGLLQVVRDFCEHSNALCSDCKFPELVRNWRLSAG
jgi:hypothetical protein